MGRVTSSVLAGLLALIATPVLVMGAVSGSGVGGSGGVGSALVGELVAAGYENGRLPDEALVTVSTQGSHPCRVVDIGGAPEMWALLVSVALADGVDIEGGWCYRTYEEQLAVWTSRQCFISGNCDGNPFPPTAEPGTSVHGWGLAIDVWGAGDQTLSCMSPEFIWMQNNGPRFGWVHPSWARCGGTGEEPWHWEFAGNPLTTETTGAGPGS